MNKTKIKRKGNRTFRKIKNRNKTRQIKKKYNRTIRGGSEQVPVGNGVPAVPEGNGVPATVDPATVDPPAGPPAGQPGAGSSITSEAGSSITSGSSLLGSEGETEGSKILTLGLKGIAQNLDKPRAEAVVNKISQIVNNIRV